jgi:predicted nucleic acid-binding protein
VKVLDTTVAVDHLRGHEEATELLARVLAAEGRVFASEIVRFEVLAGTRETERDLVADFFAAITWIAVDRDVSVTAGELARRYRSGFSGIDDADYLIAATAVVLQGDLLTTNVRHFPMFDQLEAPY